jgi:hypothetical protein
MLAIGEKAEAVQKSKKNAMRNRAKAMQDPGEQLAVTADQGSSGQTVGVFTTARPEKYSQALSGVELLVHRGEPCEEAAIRNQIGTAESSPVRLAE